MSTQDVLNQYLKKLNKVTQNQIEALREAKVRNENTEVTEEELVNKTKEYFMPLLNNLVKRACDLAIRSAENVNSIEDVEQAIAQLKKEHLDLWKSFSSLLAQLSSKEHGDSKFLEELLQDYDLRRSYVDEIIQRKTGTTSVSVSSTRLIVKDFSDRFGIFWKMINDYIKEHYREQKKELDPNSPLYRLKTSKQFREFYQIYKKYSEIKNISEGITSGMKSLQYDFEDIIETSAALESEFIDQLGHYVMFYDEEGSDFHGFTKEIFKEFNLQMKKVLLEDIAKKVKNPDFQRKAKTEFSAIWSKVVTRDIRMLLEKPPIEIVFSIMERKAIRI